MSNEQLRSVLRDFQGFRFYDRGAYEKTGQYQIDIHVIIDEEEVAESVYSVYYEYKDTSSLNKGIEQAKAWVRKLAKCRVCGCHQYNCKQCIEKTGEPCHWVEDDLCSACVPKAEIKVTDTRAVSNINQKQINSNDMDFFQNFSQIAGPLDLSMRIMQKDNELTIEIHPLSGKMTKPLRLVGTPQEVDEGFMSVIAPGIKELTGLRTNLDTLKKEIAEEGNSDEDSKSESSPPKDKKKTSPSNKTKPNPKKVKKAESKPEKLEVEEPSLLDTDPAQQDQ